jgi:subtilisin
MLDFGQPFASTVTVALDVGIAEAFTMANSHDTSPRRYLLTLDSSEARPERRTRLKPVYQALPANLLKKGELRVVASCPEYGFDLVEMLPSSAAKAQERCRKIRIDEVSFRPAVIAAPSIVPVFGTAAARRLPRIEVRDKGGSPVRGAIVTAFFEAGSPEGTLERTDDLGEAELKIERGERVDLFRVEAPGYWSTEFRDIKLDPKLTTFVIEPLDPRTDCLRHFYPDVPVKAGGGVKIGVIDTGIDLSHPDLEVAGGQNTVDLEDPMDYGCNGNPHGTHVAGIIAGRGNWPAGIRGLAPAAELYSYRVYGRETVLVGGVETKESTSRAKAAAVAEAIELAIEDGCDLINLSLEGPVAQSVPLGLEGYVSNAAHPIVPAIHKAADRARSNGAIVIAAAGNANRGSVTYPGLDQSIIAVAAMGRIGTFPPGIGLEYAVKRPPGRDDQSDFAAAFTSIGDRVALTAPGVGVISTVTGGRYKEMSGTSMACAAVTGAAARLLAKSTYLRKTRDSNRSDAIERLLFEAAKLLKFGPEYEGKGLIRSD